MSGRPEGEGWLTIDELAEKTGKSRVHTGHLAERLTEGGKLEKAVRSFDGRRRNFYRPV